MARGAQAAPGMGRGRTQSIGGTQKRWGCPGRTRNTLSSVVPPADLSGAAGISVTDIPPRQLNVASGLCSSGQAGRQQEAQGGFPRHTPAPEGLQLVGRQHLSCPRVVIPQTSPPAWLGTRLGWSLLPQNAPAPTQGLNGLKRLETKVTVS